MFIVPISQMGSISTGIQPTAVEENAGGAKVPFADILSQSFQQMEETQKISKQDAYDLAMGRSDDLHTISIHSAQATAAMELTVQIATRAVNAYKEVLQMQV